MIICDQKFLIELVNNNKRISGVLKINATCCSMLNYCVNSIYVEIVLTSSVNITNNCLIRRKPQTASHDFVVNSVAIYNN